MLVVLLAFVLYCRYTDCPERLRELAIGTEPEPFDDHGEGFELTRFRRAAARGEDSCHASDNSDSYLTSPLILLYCVEGDVESLPYHERRRQGLGRRPSFQFEIVNALAMVCAFRCDTPKDKLTWCIGGLR